MPTLIIHPEKPLAPEELDQFLPSGYRPAGQSIYATDYLRTEEDDGVYGCIQLRLPLRDFHFKKRHRRLMSKHANYFRTEIGPASLPDAAMYEVNRRYMEVHPAKSREDIEFHLVSEFTGERVLNTHCLKVFLKDRLVAFSFFDVGQRTVYTKAGIYDPAFSDYSLGTYTLLLELEWAVAQGYNYYHPGYFAPEYPVFNYKLKFGSVEYRDCLTELWHPLPKNDPSTPTDPYRHNEAALLKAQAVFDQQALPTTLMEYPSFTARFHYPNSGGRLLDVPFLLQVDQYGTTNQAMIVVYENSTAEYYCLHPQYSGLRDLKVHPFGPGGYPRYPKPVVIGYVVAAAKSPEELLLELPRQNSQD
ncbi:MAG: GNAT family N-acetyltransferase [Bacteroidota bacterium]